jgi:SAM-dependent methyltransferase
LIDRSVPHAELVFLYDAIVGAYFSVQLRHTFEWLVQRYSIRFASVADVACGTGAFVRYLCQRGVLAVYGIDRSPAMLRVALARNRGNQARFFSQEFATLQLPQPAELITCNFDSLNYLLISENLLCAFRRFHANLVPGGHAIFDMVTDRPWWQGSRPFTERITRPNFCSVRQSHWDPQRCRQTAVMTITRNGRPLAPYLTLEYILNPWGYGGAPLQLRLEEGCVLEMVIRNVNGAAGDKLVTVGGRITGRYWYNTEYGGVPNRL